MTPKGPAAWVWDWLRIGSERERVFWDVANNGVGKWRQIEQAIASSFTCVAVKDRRWADATNLPQLQDQQGMVRCELKRTYIRVKLYQARQPWRSAIARSPTNVGMRLKSFLLQPLHVIPTDAQVLRSTWRGMAISWLLIPIALTHPPSASAQATRFALTCIGTETGYTVNFAYRWGNSGTWHNSSVAPGQWVKLMWNYDYPGKNSSPQLTIRYDDDKTSATDFVRTDLKAYAASNSNCENQGKTYNFYERGTELYIRSED